MRQINLRSSRLRRHGIGRPELHVLLRHRKGRRDTCHRHDCHGEPAPLPASMVAGLRLAASPAPKIELAIAPKIGTLAWAEMRDVVVLSEHPSARRPVTD